jgi:hypothetical protein
MEIMQSDFHIPSAPAASINFISRKDKTRFAYPSPPSGSSLDWKRLANGAPHPPDSAYRGKFSGKYAYRLISGGVGHNLPQEAPQAFTQAVIDVDAFDRY